MLLSLFTLIGVSYVSHWLFTKNKLARKYDFLNVFGDKEYDFNGGTLEMKNWLEKDNEAIKA